MPKFNTKSILDARFKIIATLALTIVTFMISDWRILMILVILVLGLVQLVKLPLTYCLKKLKAPVIMVLVMTLMQLLITPSIDALWHGLLIFTRLLIVIMVWFIFIETTTQTAVTLSLEALLQPLKKIGVKIGALMLTIRIIQRFVPSLMQEASKILKAQASRGLDINSASIWMKMRLITALILPVFVIAIKKADELANTMAVRGYVLNQERTSYRSLTTIRDVEKG